jgi:nitrate/nitrite transport system substrate-binding protein
LIEAAAWADVPENRPEVARVVCGVEYVGVAEPLVAASLTGRPVLAPHAAPVDLPDFHVFHRYAAGFPWISHASWLVLQMLRWGQVAEPVDVLAAARTAYRPDLYREAAREVGVLAPEVDVKCEGLHPEPWSLGMRDGERILMGPDLFFDRRSFDPAALVKYLAESEVSSLRVSLEALAARNS